MKEYQDSLEKERMENKESLEQLRLEIAEERGKLARQAKRRRKLKKRKKEFENQHDPKIIQPPADDPVTEENLEKLDPTLLKENGKVQVIKVSEKLQVQKQYFFSQKDKKKCIFICFTLQENLSLIMN